MEKVYPKLYEKADFLKLFINLKILFMKKKILFSTLIAIMLISCSKKNEIINSNTFSANVNGVDIKFNSFILVDHSSANSVHIRGLSEFKIDWSYSNPNQPPSPTYKLDIEIEDNNPIRNGTYSENRSMVNPMFMYYSGVSYISYYDTNYPATVKIDNITTDRIQGTFQGRLRYISPVTGDTLKMDLKNGVFDIQY
jgi:hypothetical protein